MKKIALIGLLLFCGSSLFAAEEVAWKRMRTEIGMEEMINAVFSPDEKTIYATDANLKLIELSAETGDVIRVVPEFKGIIQFSDDGEYVYTYNFEKRKWPTGELIGKYPVPKDGFEKGIDNYNLGFQINEKAGLLIGAIYVSQQYGDPWSKSLLVYDLNTFKLIDTLGLDFQYYYRVVFTNDGKYFETSSDYNPDKTTNEDNRSVFMMWDSKTLKPIKENYELFNFKSSPDGKWLGSAGYPYVRVYDNKAFTEDLSLVKIYEWMPNKNCISSGLDFTHDSKYLVTSGTSCSDIIRPSIWDLEKGTLAYKYERLIGSNNLKFNKKNQIFVFTKEGLKILNWMVPSDVKEVEQNNSIIYPNPTTGMVNIEVNLPVNSLITATVADISGKFLGELYKTEGREDKNTIQLNLQNYPNGTYFITLNAMNYKKQFKIIINR